MSQTLVMIMAGGKGSRLAPLTSHRAKPAVPFAGQYRIVDFVLSNFVNSGYRRIYLLTQYMASSLIQHVQRNWQFAAFDGFIEIVPAQMRRGEHWYRGTADSVLQNFNLVRDAVADTVAVFGGDHVYKLDVREMERFHRDQDADLTVAAFPVPRSEASEFGVIQVDEQGKIVGFQEKPKDPTPIPGRPDTCLVSMGNYFFRASVLEEALHSEENRPGTSHDFGKNIIPRLLKGGASIYAWDFGSVRAPGDPTDQPAYWRDVGTVDSYIVANMDVRSRLPLLNLYNRSWPVRTANRHYPPARFVHEEGGPMCGIHDSLVCDGCIVSGAHVHKSLIGFDCFVHSRSVVDHVIALAGCNIGTGARLRRVVMDKNCSIEPGAELGYDAAADAARFPWISPGGWIVLPKGTIVPKRGPIELAKDMHQSLLGDPAAKPELERMEGRFKVGPQARHSDVSAGPRYHRYRGD